VDGGKLAFIIPMRLGGCIVPFASGTDLCD
jgi:hypothetical protein